ncbi:MAG: hypothetical protein WCJ37_08530 [Syntrophus sp. (in: bacteria)]
MDAIIIITHIDTGSKNPILDGESNSSGIMTKKKHLMPIAVIAHYGQTLLAKKQESQITGYMVEIP